MKIRSRNILAAVLFAAFGLFANLHASEPTVGWISPNLGPVGQWIYVGGTGFVAGQTTIAVGGVSGISAFVYSSTQLGFTLPDSAVGTSPITVTTPFGSSSSSELYTVGVPTEPPTITSVYPQLGPVGQWVYVNGTGFVRDFTTVSFAGISNIPSLVYGPTGLGFTIPEGSAGTSKLIVTTPNGSAESTDLITVGVPQGPPSFSRLQEYEGFNWVYMDGVNFVNGSTSIRFSDGTEVTAFVYGPDSLGFTPPPNWSSLGSITVKTPNGEYTSAFGGMAAVEFAASSTHRYQIQFSKDLKNWSPIGDPIEGEDAAFRMLATFGGSPAEFYRVRKEQK
jgi:hypothetical protein